MQDTQDRRQTPQIDTRIDRRTGPSPNTTILVRAGQRRQRQQAVGLETSETVREPLLLFPSTTHTE